MRRMLLAAVLVVASTGGIAQQALTASSTLPPTLVVHRGTTVTGATLMRLEFATTDGSITAVTARLRGTTLLSATVRAAFGGDTPVTCTAGLFTVLDAGTGLGEAEYTCLGLSEQSDRPRELALSAS